MLNDEGKETVIKISVEAFGEKFSVEFSDEIDMEEMINKFTLIATFLTFAPETIKEWLNPDPENLR